MGRWQPPGTVSTVLTGHPYRDPVAHLVCDLTGRGHTLGTVAHRVQVAAAATSSVDLLGLLDVLGTIPEEFPADSSAEKAYAKAADVIVAEVFGRLGYATHIPDRRSGSADIVAEHHSGHRWVIEVKTERASRSARNPKDYKVAALSRWRTAPDDGALLVAPGHAFPGARSRLWNEAATHRVVLAGFEHLAASFSAGHAPPPESFTAPPLDNYREWLDATWCAAVGCSPADLAHRRQRSRRGARIRSRQELAWVDDQIAALGDASRDELFELALAWSGLEARAAVMRRRLFDHPT